MSVPQKVVPHHKPAPGTEGNTKSDVQRRATLYDAVAGRVGPNGFLTPEQRWSNQTDPLAPEEVLLRKRNAPDYVEDGWYDADQRRSHDQVLPDSDLVKAIHAYASDFYSKATQDHGKYDFQSMDETALLAIGILLEEAARDSLGETGDMALVEPSGMDTGLEETARTKHQIKGKVKPPPTPEYQSENGSEDEEDDLPAKKRRY